MCVCVCVCVCVQVCICINVCVCVCILIYSNGNKTLLNTSLFTEIRHKEMYDAIDKTKQYPVRCLKVPVAPKSDCTTLATETMVSPLVSGCSLVSI